MMSTSRRRRRDTEFDIRLTARGAALEAPARTKSVRATGPRLRPADLGPAAGAEWIAHDELVTSTGTQIVHQQQYFQGLRVYRSARVVKREAPGAATTTTGTDAAIPRSLRLVPTVTPAAALDAAVAFLKRLGAFPPKFQPLVIRQHRFSLPALPTLLTARRGFAEPVRAHLEVFPAGRTQARLAWVLEVAPARGPRHEVVVAADGRRAVVLFSTQTTSCLGFGASWTPFPEDASVSRQFPIAAVAAPVGVARPGASVWLDAAGTAAGPNVTCHSGSTSGPHALTGAQFENAFVWCNLLRDFFAAFGFDRNRGAFDGGQDPLQVRLFTSKTDVGGAFDNLVDGSSPTMELFAPRGTGLHAALDPSILVHEYTHGVSCRLLGGAAQPNPFAGREAQGLNEGYSDYFALTLLSFLDRQGAGAGRDLRRIGSAFKKKGIRSYVGFSGVFSSSLTDKYDLAMVWCAALLDARVGLVALPGVAVDDADSFLWQALLDALRAMAPVCPESNCLTLAHAKDALLTAARAGEQAHPAFAGAATAIDAALRARRIG
jgi:extracellular elastinolytic metalloproteinase